MKNNRYFSLIENEEAKECDIYIYGDITSWEWVESDVSSYTLSKRIDNLDCDIINVYINSYGGEVGEGLAIYNMLKRNKAKVITHCDSFACSISSVIFMAGDIRIMSTSSLLMIHNAWTYTVGNANDLRKQANDLDKITQASVNAYMLEVNISEEELKKLLDNETWLTANESLNMNFATSITNDKKTENASQSVRKNLMNMIIENQDYKHKSASEPEPTKPTPQPQPKENKLKSIFEKF